MLPASRGRLRQPPSAPRRSRRDSVPKRPSPARSTPGALTGFWLKRQPQVLIGAAAAAFRDVHFDPLRADFAIKMKRGVSVQVEAIAAERTLESISARIERDGFPEVCDADQVRVGIVVDPGRMLEFIGQ